MAASKPTIDLNILSPYALYRPEDFLRNVRLYCDMLPDLLPEKWGWWEPLKTPFDPQRLETLVPASGRCETIDWKRTRKPKATGSFRTRRKSAEPGWNSHAHTDLYVQADQADPERLMAYLKAASLAFGADIALMDSVTPEYKELAWKSASARGGYFFLVTGVLEHWLPDIFWGTVFGPAYVRFFGKDRLMSAPAYRVEDLGPEMVYLQLSPSVLDLHTDFASVQAVRERVKRHLDNNAFFDPAGGYDWHGDPNKYPPEKPPVLNVPVFDLAPDDVPVPEWRVA